MKSYSDEVSLRLLPRVKSVMIFFLVNVNFDNFLEIVCIVRPEYLRWWWRVWVFLGVCTLFLTLDLGRPICNSIREWWIFIIYTVSVAYYWVEEPYLFVGCYHEYLWGQRWKSSICDNSAIVCGLVFKITRTWWLMFKLISYILIRGAWI